MSFLQQCTVAQLKEKCRALGLKVGGTKAQLLERLAIQRNAISPTPENTMDCKSQTKENIVISPCVKKQKVDGKVRDMEIRQLFRAYEDEENPNEINEDGLRRFFQDLKLDSQDVVVLALSYYMGAENMCTYTEDEFVRGLQKLQCHSIPQLASTLPQIREQLKDWDFLTSVYLYSYNYGKDSDQKSMHVDIAIALWQLLLNNGFERLDEWVSFVRTYGIKVVSRDVWKQILEFARHVHKDLTNYDKDGAWPVILDDFVAHLQCA